MPRQVEDYIRVLFDHDEAKGEWYDKEEEDAYRKEPLLEFFDDDSLVVEVLDIAFNNFEDHLSKYSPWQIATGMDFVFHGGTSDLCFSLQNPDVPIDRRVSVVSGLKTIFTEVFEKHCVEALTDPDRYSSELNDICFMFWEVTPIMHWGVKEVNLECIALMSHRLDSPNTVVNKSALHGLGHSVCDYPEARELIEKYIQGRIHNFPGLLDYAHDALRGRIL